MSAVPLSELSQTPGTAMVSGMIDVTVFGLIFTPMFHVATRWFAERLSHAAARRGGLGGVVARSRRLACSDFNCRQRSNNGSLHSQKGPAAARATTPGRRSCANLRTLKITTWRAGGLREVALALRSRVWNGGS